MPFSLREGYRLNGVGPPERGVGTTGALWQQYSIDDVHGCVCGRNIDADG